MRIRNRSRTLLFVLLPIAFGTAIAFAVRYVGLESVGTVHEQLTVSAETRHDAAPTYIGAVDVRSQAEEHLQPYALCLTDKQLYVGYVGSGRVDVFDKFFAYQRTLDLSTGAGSMISGIAADDTRLYVADYGRGEIRFYSLEGTLEDSYSWLPGKQDRLKPFGLTLHNGMLYVAELQQRQLLVITAVPSGKPTETGELLLRIPLHDNAPEQLDFPSSSFVTPDGRLLVSDMTAHRLQVYSCNGRFAGSITEAGDAALQSPHTLAMDDLPSPKLLARDKEIFDPSGVLCQGRIHMVDREAGEVVVFNALGEYLFRYGSSELGVPNGMVIDTGQRAVIIADAKYHCLHVYKY